MISVVWAREPIPEGPAVFLAGPSAHAGSGVESWRPAAVDELRAQSTGSLTVLTPESRGGVRADRYEDQVGWECVARARATVVLYWIPRDIITLPGYTTNVEFGFDVGRGRRVVLGVPKTCPNPERNRYLVFVAGQEGVPVRTTLPGTVEAVLELVTAAARAPRPVLAS
ncbi:nucleoside 2-deoxyribosyltransferase domain-containing protein [Lentzea sp. NBRC 102530]|uniref:nucleoside 2-deoxyribosyltransferase domain-containing protein n=1 Tax=Lentzea sp. NBRC 102530 TaxID=3032201 RepID=UPI0024A36AD2|nr:nucleoside 2-deoxyribosyltransferase domain-containing protein [Lentzea sp. NBRC 102530]GLY54854.1 hypothetical protein Lesp01_85090 [Lentzea sp. NBRC 102530]